MRVTVGRRRLGRVSTTLLLLAGSIVVGADTAGASVSTATIAPVQTGTVFRSITGGNAILTLAASTAGTMLVATLSSAATTGFTGPSGWIKALAKTGTATDAEIWYYPNNPGGITSATFTNSGTTFTAGQVSEWSGVATSSPLDKTGSASTSSTATSLAVSTAAAPSVSGEVGFASFAENFSASTANASYSRSAGWTGLGTSASASANYYTADRQLAVSTGSVLSDTDTSNTSTKGNWAGVVVTFKPVSCTAGSLTLSNSPASISFGTVTINGTDQSVTTTGTFTPSDQTGSGAGWNLTGTSTTLTSASNTLPTTATTVTAGSVVSTSGTCLLPTNALAYPITLPAGAAPPTAAKLFDAALNTGGGTSTATLTFKLTVPANAKAGSYSSTWTFSLVSGP